MLLKENSEAKRIVNVIDCPMGCGKTSAMINYMNNMPEAERVVYCAPYISEGERIAERCCEKGIINISEDKYDDRKITDLRTRVKKGQNVACTHALFELLDDDILESVRRQNYTLVIDEAYEVLRTFSKAEMDKINFLIENKLVRVERNTGRLFFANQSQSENCLRFSRKITNLINRGDICYGGDEKISVWTFPIKVLNAFRCIVVMTYMFDAQTMRYYLQSNEYRFYKWGVRENRENEFEICKPELSDGFRYNVADKIHIYNGDKLNSIGESRGSLSATWYKRNKNNDGKTGVKQLAKNYVNVQEHIYKCSSKDFMWTCFGACEDERFKDDMKKRIAGWQKNLRKNFVSVTKRACNEYSDRHYLAYGVNWTTHPLSYNYFKSLGYTMDRDGWELSMMLQWIWRSAIRNGEEIYIYVPSKKMRTLLQNWIAEVSSKGGDAIEQ